MKCWEVRKVENEWHVIETRFVNEPEYTLARCSGPVPANDIATAMRLAQTMNDASSRIHNTLFNLTDAFKRFQLDVKQAQKPGDA
jgi:hypothetical protein